MFSCEKKQVNVLLSKIDFIYIIGVKSEIHGSIIYAYYNIKIGRYIDRQTDRQTDGQTDRQRDRQRERQRQRQREILGIWYWGIVMTASGNINASTKRYVKLLLTELQCWK